MKATCFRIDFKQYRVTQCVFLAMDAQFCECPVSKARIEVSENRENLCRLKGFDTKQRNQRPVTQ